MRTQTLPMFLFLALLAGGCSRPVGYAPGTTDAMRDELHKSTPRPVIEANKKHIISVVEVDMPVPLEEYNRFSETVPLEKVLVGTKQIPRVLRTEPLNGAFGEPGSRRRVVLEDGNTALEEILEKEPGSFRYVVWNFTSRAGRYVSYAEGHFHKSATPTGTHIRWTYSFRPKAWIDGVLISSFVHNDYHAFMEQGMAAMRRLLEARAKDAGPQ